MEWFSDNKDWIFSGIGVAVATAVIRGFVFLLKRRAASTDGDESSSFVDEFELGPYTMAPASTEDIRWVAIKARELYGSRDSIPVETKLSWFEAFPTGFWVIRNRMGGNVGSLELIPLREDVIIQLANGKLREADLTQEDIEVPADTTQKVSIYIENLMSVRNDNNPNQWAFKRCLMFTPTILERLSLVSQEVTLFAMPVREFMTKHGKRHSPSERLLQRLGFSKIADRTRQGYPLYSSNLNKLRQTLVSMLGEEATQQNQAAEWAGGALRTSSATRS